jgi:hypothetical protein
MATETQTSEPRHEQTHFEHSDVFGRGVVITGILVFVGVWITAAVVLLFFNWLKHEHDVTSPPPLPAQLHGNPMPPEPRLQTSPRQDLKAMRTNEDWNLSHYAWVDKSAGRVSIPIDRAIEIVAQRGIPPQKTPAGVNLSQPQAGTRLTGFEGKVEPEPR